MFDPSLTCGMSAVLMWGHFKHVISADRVAHRKCGRQNPPHLTRHVHEGWINVEPTILTFCEKLMNVQYLNLSPTPIAEWYG